MYGECYQDLITFTNSLSTLSQKSAAICRRKVRLSHFSAVFGYSLTFVRQSHFSATVHVDRA